jgi:hypothetical protein
LKGLILLDIWFEIGPLEKKKCLISQLYSKKKKKMAILKGLILLDIWFEIGPLEKKKKQNKNKTKHNKQISEISVFTQHIR